MAFLSQYITPMNAPVAKKIEHYITAHGDRRPDPYYWLRERGNPEVITYLEGENKYAEEMMADTHALQQQLFDEMKARYNKEDESVPYFFNDYWYTVKYHKGGEYPVFYRQHLTLDAPEELLLDVNKLADGLEYFDIGSLSVSPDNKILAFGHDTVGRRQFDISFKDLSTGEIFADVVGNTTGKVVWAADSEHLFYITKDESLRPDKVFRHRIKTAIEEDALVYHEEDETFDIGLFKTKSQQYIFIASSSTLSDEQRFIPATEPFADWTVVQTREEDLEYSVDHYDDCFYIITNEGDAFNFKIVTTPVAAPGKENWIDLVKHRDDVLLEGFEIFKDYFVVEERKDGLLQIAIRENSTDAVSYLPFTEPTYTAFISTNLQFDSEVLRYGYTSLTRPSATLEYNMRTGATVLLKEQEVKDPAFKKENYKSERLWATARDGARVPVSLVYHKDTQLSAETPLLLYGYGSYGHTVDAAFSFVRLSLLDRGFVYAIAHIRGGEYLGREWYEDGKMLLKKNTFHDFIDVAKFLIEENYTSSPHLYAMGGSAGGLLMGAVMNMAPALFNGIVAQVPFVDVVTTMLDESIPLTTGEYNEWGNPADEEYYHYMKSYSPYDNVEAKAYPNLLVTTGLHDSQVQYWEPAKWVAKLRDMKTDDNLLLLKTDMSAGHSGTTGRFESLWEDVLEYAFILKVENN